jgi:ectoine hydroxylase-related dioxygenase (phytanoyl-CoA dioxygenase family)
VWRRAPALIRTPIVARFVGMAEAVVEEEVAGALAEIRDRGFTLLENVIEPALLDWLSEQLLRIERDDDVRPASNDFEGEHTIRLYNLLVHGGRFAEVPIHPTVLPVVQGVLDRGCLLSSISSIAIDPGESAQPIHSDDQLIGLPRPHPPVVCNTMWALSDFTEENGATRVIPGSHAFDHYPEYGHSFESVPAVMKRGSVLIWNGGLWHGGGENRSKERRLGMAVNYCAGWVRQQENQQLGVPRELVETFPRRLQRLMGYGVYRQLIGHIDKTDPISLLGGESEMRTVWDT